MIIIDREYRVRYDINNKKYNEKYYKYKCNICDYSDGWIIENSLLKNVGCACCAGQIVVEGINDIPTTAPWMVKYFQGGYNEAKLYTKNSGKKIKPLCPDCGRISNKEIIISNINKRHSINCICNDKKSYPEKFLYNVFQQLNLQFDIQKMFNWSRNIKNINIKLCGNKQYDFYILIINSIIETHGEHHYKKSFSTKRKLSLFEIQENDKIKEQIAIDNGINNYIILDCRYSNLNWIKNNILHSKLNNLFDLSTIDWNKCHEFACSNLIKTACELKRDNPNLTTTKIGNILGLKRNTISRYLKQGNEIWDWVNYNPKQEMNKILSKGSIACRKRVEIFRDNISLGIFESCNELERQSQKLFDIKLYHSKISDVCKGKIQDYKNFTFKYLLD